MNEIRYRKIKKEDYKAVQSMINHSFGLYKYINNEKVLNTLLKVYLQSCLAEKTFSCVAEKDGEVVGIILGQAKRDYKLLPHLPNILAMAYFNIVMSLQAVWYKEKVKDYKNMHQIYHELLKDRKNEFDGVLTLFAITENCRGFGVGKKLLSKLNAYLKEKGTNQIYLFTDSTCNYGFYDSQGFERVEERDLEVTSEHKRKKLNVFLYKYKIK